MKNYDEMYQSVLSKYDEYQEKKQKRIRTIRRTVPVLACFCLTIALGVGYWDHFKNLPHIPVQPNIIEESTIEAPYTTTAVTNNNTTIQTENITEPATATSPVQSSESDRTASTEAHQQQTVTTVVSETQSNIKTEPATDKSTETQVPVTTKPVTNTQPVTELQTTSPVQIPTETQTSVVSDHEPPIVTETTEPILPVGPPAQPIRFTDINDAIGAVNASDVSSYPEHEQESYRYMFERIKSDGFLYQVNNTDTVSLIEDRGISLFPYAKYEDVGVGCFVRYKDVNYHITFYYADCDLLAQTNSIAEYLQSRMGRRSDKEINVSDSNVSLFFADNGQTYAGAFIDSDHYYTVNTVASEEEMVEFIEALSFEPLPLV